MTEPDPIARFRHAYEEARATETFDVARAALATADTRGRPSLRFVLVKEFDARGLCVFTNLESRKAREMAANPFAALTFHWHSTGVQVRFEGPIAPVSASESDAYFASRPRGSQIGAWASHQSQPVASREVLEARVAELGREYEGRTVPRPPYWGGWRLCPESIEFWRDRRDRLHDRELYTRAEQGWSTQRLSP
ncbi:MAG TPA: pyridoxamine 5'-phosphate oxidase [Polyangiales bacterium]|nr:pyridoxamine 5'-phosphate oxidase [Polyangiales bacterium]